MLTFSHMFDADVIITWPIVGATTQHLPSKGSRIAQAVERGLAAGDQRREREMRCHEDAPAKHAEVRQFLRQLSYIRDIFDSKWASSFIFRTHPAFDAQMQRAIPARSPRDIGN
ncbi:hypothetical protein [Sphingomonas sp. OK281]|uniref:hypothetical protein n=1 Tax=Sphingomonas sp. OK281 TaxID=1881067 RepID=UPI001113DF2D|nr:hypothetical protein [Sphingomonas sp. OK281]